MKKLSVFLQYLKFYFEPKHRVLQAEAAIAARKHFKSIRSTANPNPTPIDYERRRIEFQAFQRGYINAYRHSYAKTALEK